MVKTFCFLCLLACTYANAQQAGIIQADMREEYLPELISADTLTDHTFWLCSSKRGSYRLDEYDEQNRKFRSLPIGMLKINDQDSIRDDIWTMRMIGDRFVVISSVGDSKKTRKMFLSFIDRQGKRQHAKEIDEESPILYYKLYCTDRWIALLFTNKINNNKLQLNYQVYGADLTKHYATSVEISKKDICTEMIVSNAGTAFMIVTSKNSPYEDSFRLLTTNSNGIHDLDLNVAPGHIGSITLKSFNDQIYVGGFYYDDKEKYSHSVFGGKAIARRPYTGAFFGTLDESGTAVRSINMATLPTSFALADGVEKDGEVRDTFISMHIKNDGGVVLVQQRFYYYDKFYFYGPILVANFRTDNSLYYAASIPIWQKYYLYAFEQQFDASFFQILTTTRKLYILFATTIKRICPLDRPTCTWKKVFRSFTLSIT